MVKRILTSALALLFIIGFLPACIGTPVLIAQAKIVVNKLEVTPNEIAAGETVTINTQLSNIGGISENYTAILNIDGKERDRITIVIEPSENRTVTFMIQESSIGKHDVEINDVNSNFTVYETAKYTLKHDNNQMDYFWYRGDPGGLWIKYNPPTVPFYIDKIVIAGKRTDFSQPEKKQYTIKIWDQDFKKELYSKDYPYTNFSTYAKMVTHEINPPLVVSDNFTIEVISHCEGQPGGWPNDKTIAIATDHSVGSSQYIGSSMFGSNSINDWNSMVKWDPMLVYSSWIIRVEGTGKKAEAVIPSQDGAKASLQDNPVLTLQHDNNACSFLWMMNDPWGQWIRFDGPTVPFEIRKISIKGSRSPYPLSGNNTYTLKIWDGNFNKQLFTYDYPYTNFSPQGGLVDHDINPPVIVTGTFIIEFISHSEWNDHSITSKDTRIYLCTDSAVTSRDNIGISYFGSNQEDTYKRQIQMEPRFSHATWIIRVAGTKPAVQNVPSVIQGDNKTNQIVPTATNQTTPAVPTADNQTTRLQGVPATLRYDYLNSEENLFTQIAVWHSMATFSAPNWGIAGKFVESPLIILPGKEGAVAITGDGSGGYKFLPIGTISYRNTVDEIAELSKPGWGLATTFHPEKTPFSIGNIKIAAVANYTTGIPDDYDKKFVIINILNAKSEVIWSKQYKWSDFRNPSTTSSLPQAIWKEIPVGVTVEGDFTVDILALSYTYTKAGNQYNYLAIAYEKFEKCGDVTTNSFISGNGKRYNSYIRLYDQYGMPVCFNVCIRVDGSY